MYKKTTGYPVVFCKIDCYLLLIAPSGPTSFYLPTAGWPNSQTIAIRNGTGCTTHIRIDTTPAQAGRNTTYYFLLFAFGNFFAQLKSGLLFHFLFHTEVVLCETIKMRHWNQAMIWIATG
jgi:hypothetical protein